MFANNDSSIKENVISINGVMVNFMSIWLGHGRWRRFAKHVGCIWMYL